MYTLFRKTVGPTLDSNFPPVTLVAERAVVSAAEATVTVRSETWLKTWVYALRKISLFVPLPIVLDGYKIRSEDLEKEVECGLGRLVDLHV